MNPLAYHIITGNILIDLIILVIIAAFAFYAVQTFIMDAFLRKLLHFVIVAVVVILLIASFTGCSSLAPGTVATLTAPPSPEESRALTSLAVGDFLILGVSDKDRPAVAAQLNSAADIFLRSASGELPAPDDLRALLSAQLPPSKTKDLVILNFVSVYRLRYGALSTIPLQLPQSDYAKAIAAGVKDATLINSAQ